MIRYLSVINRITAAILGGYAFTWGFCALSIAGLVALGVSFHAAETGSMLVAFLLFLGLFLWTFAAQNMAKIWLVLAGGAVAMISLSLVLQRALVA
jgi:hypothetical protein